MQNNSEELKDLQDQVNRIIQAAGVDIDEDYIKDLEKMFDINLDEIDKGFSSLMDKKKIQIERIHPDAIVPKYAYQSDSGFDLYSVEQMKIGPFGRALVSTGIKVSFPEGFEIQVRPKSGLAINMGLTVLNTPGTVDQGYTGEIQVIVFNTNNNSILIEKGMKIAQGVLCPVVSGKYAIFEEVSKLDPKDRGDNGFGSTGI
jgi:dUTP pyrophosphatase